MTTEDKVDLILQRLEDQKQQPKKKDGWDKAQVISSAFVGVVAIILTYFNLQFTSALSRHSLDQADSLRLQQRQFHDNEDIRNRREETIEEVKALPTLVSMKNSHDQIIQQLANGIIDILKKDPSWQNLPFGIFARTADSLPTSREASKLAAQPRSDKSFWVYLGVWQNADWQVKNFDIIRVPKPGDVITSSATVFARDSEPKNQTPQDEDKWYLGRPIGVVKAHQQVKVDSITTLSGDNCWAKVHYI